MTVVLPLFFSFQTPDISIRRESRSVVEADGKGSSGWLRDRLFVRGADRISFGDPSVGPSRPSANFLHWGKAKLWLVYFLGTTSTKKLTELKKITALFYVCRFFFKRKITGRRRRFSRDGRNEIFRTSQLS